jgi:hypothetical protein
MNQKSDPMKYIFAIILLISLSAQAQPGKLPNHLPPHKATDLSVPSPIKQDSSTRHELSITDFGAHSGTTYDNADVLQTAVTYAIQNRLPLNVPIGDFFTSRSILAQNNGYLFSLTIRGVFSAKCGTDGWLSKIFYTGKSGYAFGVQLGHGILIENLMIQGVYNPPAITAANIGVIKFTDWIQPGITDTRYDPYAGFSIDPSPNANGQQGGTSGVMIRDCAVKNFMVGFAVSPNGVTTNAEMINFIDDDVEACRIAFAICQDQSKEIHIDRFKCWAATYTILDGLTYGAGTGGGSVMIDGMNIAGAVNQLFNLNTDRFPLSARNIYSESLFRIGNVGKGTGANFDNFQIDFLTGAGMPEADYLLVGQANFHGGSLRYYDNDKTHRLNLCNMDAFFRDMTLNTPPMTLSLYGMGVSSNPNPRFDNIHISCGNYLMNPGRPDAVFVMRTQPVVTINRTKWTARFARTQYQETLQIGQYILACPTNKSGHYWDTGMNSAGCPTITLGRIVSLTADSVFMDHVGVNAVTGQGYDNIYVSLAK